MTDHEAECAGRADNGWHRFENVFHGDADTCLYCGISRAQAFQS